MSTRSAKRKGGCTGLSSTLCTNVLTASRESTKVEITDVFVIYPLLFFINESVVCTISKEGTPFIVANPSSELIIGVEINHNRSSGD